MRIDDTQRSHCKFRRRKCQNSVAAERVKYTNANGSNSIINLCQRETPAVSSCRDPLSAETETLVPLKAFRVLRWTSAEAFILHHSQCAFWARRSASHTSALLPARQPWRVILLAGPWVTGGTRVVVSVSTSRSRDVPTSCLSLEFERLVPIPGWNAKLHHSPRKRKRPARPSVDKIALSTHIRVVRLSVEVKVIDFSGLHRP